MCVGCRWSYGCLSRRHCSRWTEISCRSWFSIWSRPTTPRCCPPPRNWQTRSSPPTLKSTRSTVRPQLLHFTPWLIYLEKLLSHNQTHLEPVFNSMNAWQSTRKHSASRDSSTLPALWRCRPSPLQWYLHRDRPDLKAPRLKTCCILAYRLSYARTPDYSGEAADQASNGSFDFFQFPHSSRYPVPLAGVGWRKQRKKELSDETYAGKGIGRDVQRGKERWEDAAGEMGAMRRKGEERWKGRRKCWDEKEEENHNTLHRGHGKLDTSFHQTKLFISYPVSSSSLNVDILQLCRPGNGALCFLSVFDKGNHGGWSSVDPGARLPLMEGCCCLLQRSPSQLETHLWAFLRLLPVRSKQRPPSEHICISL